jgi:hypothetical protein
MASLYLLAIIEYVPLYLNGYLSYISSYSLRLSPLTLKPLDLILNTAFILLLLYSLLSSKGLKLSTSPVSPRHPLYLYFFLFLHSSLIPFNQPPTYKLDRPSHY